MYFCKNNEDTMALVIPEGYHNILGSVENTEKAIKAVKDMFQDNLSAQLALLRVTAPMVVLSGTGLNDDLNGVESPVSFTVRDMDGSRAEVVHSLAKWKRFALKHYGFGNNEGLYTEEDYNFAKEAINSAGEVYMNPESTDEEIDNAFMELGYIKKRLDMPENSHYVNAGVLMFNLEEMRKFCTTQDIFDYIEKNLKKATESYAKAYKQLTGKGSLVTRAQRMRELGVKANKTLPSGVLDAALEDGDGESE